MRRLSRHLAVPDHPLAPAAIAGAAAVVLVAARLVFGTEGDITRFIVVGATNVSGHGLPPGVHVFSGSGYDGQFYFRQALSPFNVSTVAHGIRLDGEYRLQRLAYPLLGYLAAGGQAAAVPYSLVALNVAGLFAIGLLGGLIARDAGRHACYGLLLAGYFGLVTTLARDLTEIIEVTFLLAAFVANRRRRYLAAGLAFAAAVLTKETEVFVVAGVAAVLLVRTAVGGARRPAFRAFVAGGPLHLRLASPCAADDLGLGSTPGPRQDAPGAPSPRPPAAAHLVWLLPAGAFVGTQLWLLAATGHLAGSSGAEGNFALPLTAVFRAVGHYAARPATLADAIWLGELAVLVVVIGVAVASLRGDGATAEEKMAFLFLIGLALSLSGEVWNGQADFRSLAPLFELAGVVLLGSRRRLGILLAIAAIAFLVTFVHRVRFT